MPDDFGSNDRVCELCGYEEGPDAETPSFMGAYEHELCVARGGHVWASEPA